MARKSIIKWEIVQNYLNANATGQSGLTSQVVFMALADELGLPKTKEQCASFQSQLSGAMSSGKVTGFQAKKGAGGGIFPEGHVPVNNASELPSMPSKTLKVAEGVTIRVKATGVVVKANNASTKHDSLGDALEHVAGILVTSGASEATSVQEMVSEVRAVEGRIVSVLAAKLNVPGNTEE